MDRMSNRPVRHSVCLSHRGRVVGLQWYAIPFGVELESNSRRRISRWWWWALSSSLRFLVSCMAAGRRTNGWMVISGRWGRENNLIQVTLIRNSICSRDEGAFYGCLSGLWCPSPFIPFTINGISDPNCEMIVQLSFVLCTQQSTYPLPNRQSFNCNQQGPSFVQGKLKSQSDWEWYRTWSLQKYPNPTIPAMARSRQIRMTDRRRLDLVSILLIS